MADESVELIASMSVVELGIYLKEIRGIPSSATRILEDNEIDGQEFMALTLDEIKSLFPGKLGIAKKLYRLSKKDSAPVYISTPVEKPATERSLSVESPLSPFSPQFSLDWDDTESLASSASALAKSVFRLPDLWRPSIMYCIEAPTEDEQRKRLSAKIRNEMVRDVVTQMFSFQPKPTASFCKEVSILLVQKYPFLRDAGKNVSGYGSWQKKITERVHNVTKTKKTPVAAGNESSRGRRGKGGRKLLEERYPPLQVSTDEISHSKNMDALEKEMSKEKPRKEAVLRLMRDTYPLRRQYILSKSSTSGVTFSTILEQQPALTLPYAIEMEMDLILDKKDVISDAVHNWKTTWVPAIHSYAETLTGKQRTDFRQSRETLRGDADMEGKVALILLCKVFSKKGPESTKKCGAAAIIYEERQMKDDPDEVAHSATTSPRFARFKSEEQDSYIIFVGQKVLCSVTSFTRALMLWFACHYTFNLEYCKHVKEVAWFFQDCVFELPLSGKKTGTYLAIATDVRNHVIQE